MRSLKVLSLLAIAACGGGGGGDAFDAATDHDAATLDAEVPVPPDAEVPVPPDAEVPDAEVPDADLGPDAEPPTSCDPIAQTGCGPSEKCTWVNVDDFTGVLDCVPNGTVALNDPCVMGPDGATTGFDDCLAGNYCIGGVCEPICTDAPDSCASGSACSIYSGVFEGFGLGVCDFLCDPVTQVRTSDGAAACGSAVPATPNRGCYGYFDLAFACTPLPAPVLADPLMYQQGDTAYGPGTGGAYLNGCAPGYAPLLNADFGDTAPTICLALCTPGPTSLENPANANGLVGSGHTCADRGAPAPTYECRYLWYFETGPLHPDNVGFCWDPDDYLYDWDNNVGTPDTGAPRCSTIATADQAGLGCAPY